MPTSLAKVFPEKVLWPRLDDASPAENTPIVPSMELPSPVAPATPSIKTPRLTPVASFAPTRSGAASGTPAARTRTPTPSPVLDQESAVSGKSGAGRGELGGHGMITTQN